MRYIKNTWWNLITIVDIKWYTIPEFYKDRLSAYKVCISSYYHAIP